jgi:hypothetical protein
LMTIPLRKNANIRATQKPVILSKAYFKYLNNFI